MIDALTEHYGIVTDACQKVGIARKTHYEWYKLDSEYKQQVDDIQETALDFVETKLFKNIKDGKEASIFYYLNNRGGSRGYNRNNMNPELEHKKTIVINFPKDFNDLPDTEDKVNTDR